MLQFLRPLRFASSCWSTAAASRCNKFSTTVPSLSELPKDKFYENFLQDVNRRIEFQQKIIRKHSASHLKSREAQASIANLKASMTSVQQKKAAQEPPNTICNIPSHVSIEVLGNGTGLMRPCVLLRTPLRTYLFNCPENTCRFLQQLRIRPANVVDVFVTSSTWDNIAGISSVLLAKENFALPTRIHGAMNVKHFLECIRPFQDSDYGSHKYPSQVDEYPYTNETYEDPGFRVTYIPLSPPFSAQKDVKSAKKRVFDLDIAYLLELKEPPRKIDANKLIEKKIPKGPLIGRLKNGEAVTLPDGRTIQPEEEKTRVLVAECTSIEYAEALLENSALKPFLVKEKHLDYMVHLSRDEVLGNEMYKGLIRRLPETQHIVVNEANPEIPCVESIYKHTRLLRSIAPSLFPELHPIAWTGLVTQNDELQTVDGSSIRAAPLQRFWMRHGNITNEEPILADLRDGDADFNPETAALIRQLGVDAANLKMDAEFPKVTFLGTSSAVPSKYRNVTGYLVEASDDSAFLIDVGEGTYGQMRAARGVDGCKKILLALNCILVTHAHQDHMNGLYTVIERRKEAFDEAGVPYRPLLLVSNRNVLKPLKTYSMCFVDLESLVEIVDISRHPLTPPGSPSSQEPPGKRRKLPSPHLPPARDVLELFPRPLFDENAWGLNELKAVQVHHTRMANGFVLGVAGKRLVFSGDTKPCDLLCTEGVDADLLVHEATFEDGHEVDAMRKRHSTMGQAVDVAKKMRAKNVILTHFSARYPKVPALPEYLDELKIGIAMDMLTVRFDHLPLVPRLNPIYRSVFEEELFEITLKKEQRDFRLKEDAKSGGEKQDSDQKLDGKRGKAAGR